MLILHEKQLNINLFRLSRLLRKRLQALTLTKAMSFVYKLCVLTTSSELWMQALITQFDHKLSVTFSSSLLNRKPFMNKRFGQFTGVHYFSINNSVAQWNQKLLRFQITSKNFRMTSNARENNFNSFVKPFECNPWNSPNKASSTLLQINSPKIHFCTRFEISFQLNWIAESFLWHQQHQVLSTLSDPFVFDSMSAVSCSSPRSKHLVHSKAQSSTRKSFLWWNLN